MPDLQQALCADDAQGYLEGAARLVANVPFCWLVTTDALDGTNARPMGRILHHHDQHAWVIRFVTDMRSKKAAEILRSETIGLIVQDDAQQAFAWLTGSAGLLGGFEDVRRYWKDAYAAYFPSPEDQANVAFVEVRVERMALWIKGVTPEPFGIRPTHLERDADNTWRSAQA